MSKRVWSRPNPDYPAHPDKLYVITRRVQAGTKVTMYTIQMPLGGKLDRTETVWTDPISMLNALDELREELRADGWEFEG